MVAVLCQPVCVAFAVVMVFFWGGGQQNLYTVSLGSDLGYIEVDQPVVGDPLPPYIGYISFSNN